jgi:anti-anti-sigma regulatory factor
VLCSLLLEELTIPKIGDDFHRIILDCRSVEYVSECLAEDGAP